MAKTFTKCYPLLEKDNIVPEISRIKRLLQRLGYVQRKATTGNVTIPFGASKKQI